MRPTLKHLLLSFLVIGLFTGSAHAQFNAYSLVPVRNGNSGFTGSLGLDFNVNTTIEVTRLGIFDSGANGIAGAGQIRVALFNRTTQVQITTPVVFSSADPGVLDGNYRFKSSAPLLLLPGQYSIVAWGFSNTNQVLNAGIAGGAPAPTTNTGGGLVTFVGTGRFSFAQGVFPTTIDGGPLPRYGAGNFTFQEFQSGGGGNVAPEPASGVLVGCTLLGIAALGVRRTKP